MQLLCLWWRCIVPERKKKVVLRSELSSAAEWTHYGLCTRYSQLLLCVKSHYGSCLSTPRYYRQQLSSKKTDV